jgi:hypothetical protein
LQNPFEQMLVYREDGVTPIDDNETEQRMKQGALG